MNKIQQIAIGLMALSVVTTFPPEGVTNQEKQELENISMLSIVGSVACLLSDTFLK